MTVVPESLIDPPELTNSAQSLLGEVLSHLHIGSALFLRAEYTEPWAYESPSCEVLCSVLQPGAQRLILFHIVAKGRCWIEIDGGEPMWAEEGDIIMLPYAHIHRMGGSMPSTPVPIGSLLPPQPWHELPVIRYGGGGPQTEIVCGFLHCEDLLFDPTLHGLSPLCVVRPPAGPAAAWVAASIQYAMMSSQPGASPGATRLPELLFTEALRLHMATLPPSAHGWLSALRDPVLASALGAIHRSPARPWTLASLAKSAATSRTVLDDRFRVLLGRSPIKYLTQWRMQLATHLLANPALGMVAVAEAVGYQSEAAFTRAFKRHHGLPPVRWRTRKGEL